MAGFTDSVSHLELPEAAGSGLVWAARYYRIWLASLFASGFLVRLYYAGFLFLDPDEALHYWVSVQPSVGGAYHATLSTAHPPLFILFLYYWRWLGHAEVLLRLPGVLAGLAFCWIAYRWVARVADERAAEIALPLLLFTPSLIWVSAEVRQYWLLLLFIALALYCFERAVVERSIGWMIGFTVALDIALASHYSALLFALAMGIYGLFRLGSVRENRKLLLACALGQLSALAEVGIFFTTHIALLQKSGLPHEIADTWLRKSIFHPGEDHVISFLLRDTVRFFRYLFGNGVVGALGLAAFAVGVLLVFRNRDDRRSVAPGDRARTPLRGRVALESAADSAALRVRNRDIAMLVTVPFVIAVGTALAGIYPYGGTRHDVFVAPFAILGISIAVSFWTVRHMWMRTAVVLFVLALANLFPSPAGPFIKPRDQSKALMAAAIATLRGSRPGSVVFTDYAGGLLLSYYLCDHLAVQVVPPYQPFSRNSCGQLNVVSEAPSGSAIGQQWTFGPGNFAQEAKEVVKLYELRPDEDLLVFRAGWSLNSDVALEKVLDSLGCNAPLRFGRNILICKIRSR